jgi:sugar/nucleoside kinase (ribokinase family)
VIRRDGAILVAGNIVDDEIVAPVDDIPANGTLWVEHMVRSLGGNGANTSYTIAKLGVPVRLLGVVGDDEAGDWVREHLESAGVDTSHLERLPGATAATVALVRRDGSRRFLHQPGIGKQGFAGGIDFQSHAATGCAHFHLANLFSMPYLRANAGGLLRQAREAGLTTSLDTGWDSKGEWMNILAPCLPHLDILAVNEDEGEKLTGLREPERYLARFMKAGIGCQVAKLGPQGCAVGWGGIGGRFPAFEVDAVDTTGAGDCWMGGFLAALHRGLDVGEAAMMANAVGALSVQAYGSVSGLRDWQATLDWRAARS